MKVEYYSVDERFRNKFVERMEQNIAEEGDVSSMALFEDLMKRNADCVTKKTFIMRYYKDA